MVQGEVRAEDDKGGCEGEEETRKAVRWLPSGKLCADRMALARRAAAFRRTLVQGGSISQKKGWRREDEA